MFYSLKSRTALAGGLMLLAVVAIAFYGRTIFQDTILYGVENAQKQQKLNRIIIGMKYPITAIEAKIYEYLISLEDSDKQYIPLYIQELQTQLKKLDEDEVVLENSAFKKHVAKLNQYISDLDKYYFRLQSFTRTERYPITQLLNNKLNPTNNELLAAIQILESSQDELEKTPLMSNFRLEISELRYITAQIFNSTRLLFVSKTEIFGTSEATINFLIKNHAEYQNHFNEIALKLSGYLQYEDLDLSVEAAIEQLNAASIKRQELVKEVVKTLRSERWREDLYYMEKTLKPTLSLIQGEFNLMERRLEKLSTKNIILTKEASSLLSNFLWIFAAMVIVVFLSIYLLFERWLRKPLNRISQAMNSESNQQTEESLTEIGIQEIDNVIIAFEHMRKEIKIRQQRLSYILENAGEGIIVADSNGKIDSFNASAEEIFQTNESDVKHQDVTQFINIQTIKSDIEWLSNISSDSKNEHLNYFLDGTRSNGEKFKCDITLSHMLLNQAEYVIIVVRDATKRLINQHSLELAKEQAEQASSKLEEQVAQLDQSMSDLKKTQEQLVESEKSASLAGLVAGVAHEINTPVGVSVTASSHLGDEIKELKVKFENNTITQDDLDEFIADAAEACSIIDANLQRAANLVKSFKMVAVDRTSDESRDINLKEYLDEVLLSLRPQLKKTRHVINNEIEPTIHIVTSPGALSQVFTNFIMNSLIHGFEDIEKGSITVDAKYQNNILHLGYCDNGKGMNNEQRKKIFEPFFTTKRGKGGSGLGMHIVLNLVTQKLNGFIKCESTPGQGCRFDIDIPIDEKVS